MGAEDTEVEATEMEVTTEAEVPTPEQQVETLKAQLKDKEDSYKGLQTKYNKVYEDYKKQADWKAELEEIKANVAFQTEAQRLLAAMLAERGDIESEEVPAGRKQDLLKRYEAKEQELAVKKREAEAKSRQNAYNQQADALHNRAVAVFAEDEDALYQIRAYLRAGDLDLAEKKIAKAESKSKTSIPSGKTETEEERTNRLVEEKYQTKLKEAGLLKTDTATPSGRTKSEHDILARYASGDRSVEAEARKILGF